MTAKKVWKPIFLEQLRRTGNVSASARAAGITRQGAYKERDNSATFAADWDDAIEEGIDYLEAEARRRAFEGVSEPVFYQGQEVSKIQKYSDTLAIFLLKGRRPEVYGDKLKQEISGPREGPIQVIEVGSSDNPNPTEGETWP